METNGEDRKPGPKVDRLKSDFPWDHVAEKMIRTPKLKEGWPDEVKKTRGRKSNGQGTP